MSFQHRVVPVLLASLVGVVSGTYLFGPPLQQYKVDSRGTSDPDIANAAAHGGAGGALADPKEIEKARADKSES